MLHGLLLLRMLLVLRHRAPLQPDTTRATCQSTEGGGGQLLGKLLLTSSVSIPGELLPLLLLMLLVQVVAPEFHPGVHEVGISEKERVKVLARVQDGAAERDGPRR